jgi:glucose/arabinose dehydrogenase
VLLTIGKPYEDHNGGQLAFGPDGYLYIGIGDGGAKSEEERNAQRRTSLLGKVLRIDVDSEGDGRLYGIPEDNPFATHAEYKPEIWAYGLRNPWRFSFDRQTGDLYLADVGLWSSEEVNVQPAGAPGGRNYGWNLVEGFECHDQARADRCDSTTLTPPVWVYHHDQGCAIVGGFVYRGSAVAALSGQYVFGDYCLGTIWGMSNVAGVNSAAVLLETELNINSFGEDEAGELYVAAMDGVIYRVVAA